MTRVPGTDGDPKETRNERAATRMSPIGAGDIGSVGDSVQADGPSLNGPHWEGYTHLKSRPQDKPEVPRTTATEELPRLCLGN